MRFERKFVYIKKTPNIYMRGLFYAVNIRNYPSTEPVATASVVSATGVTSAAASVARAVSVVGASSMVASTSIVAAVSTTSTAGAAATSATGAVSTAGVVATVSSPQAVMAMAANTMAACFNIFYSPDFIIMCLRARFILKHNCGIGIKQVFFITLFTIKRRNCDVVLFVVA